MVVNDHASLSQSLRNQGFIRTEVPFTIHDSYTSQSLRNQGFIRTEELMEQYRLNLASIPSKSGFHSNLVEAAIKHFEQLSQSLRNQGFIRTVLPSSTTSARWCLNPFEIRVSFEPRKPPSSATPRPSQSLRNQGFIRTGV